MTDCLTNWLIYVWLHCSIELTFHLSCSLQHHRDRILRRYRKSQLSIPLSDRSRLFMDNHGVDGQQDQRFVPDVRSGAEQRRTAVHQGFRWGTQNTRMSWPNVGERAHGGITCWEVALAGLEPGMCWWICDSLTNTHVSVIHRFSCLLN